MAVERQKSSQGFVVLGKSCSKKFQKEALRCT